MCRCLLNDIVPELLRLCRDARQIILQQDPVTGDRVECRVQVAVGDAHVLLRVAHSMTMRGAVTASSASARSILSATRPAIA